MLKNLFICNTNDTLHQLILTIMHTLIYTRTRTHTHSKMAKAEYTSSLLFKIRAIRCSTSLAAFLLFACITPKNSHTMVVCTHTRLHARIRYFIVSTKLVCNLLELLLNLEVYRRGCP